MSHDMCGNRVADTDGTVLGCMRSAGHWSRRAIPHYDASEDRSWLLVQGKPLIWDGDVRRREAESHRIGTALHPHGTGDGL